MSCRKEGLLVLSVHLDGSAFKIKGRKIIGGCFGAANHLNGAVLLEQQLCGTELAVVIIAHGEAVRTGIVNHQEIPDVNCRKIAVDGELVVVFAERTGYVINNSLAVFVLAHDRYVVISAVHSGAHKVAGAGVYAYVMLIGFLSVNRLGNEMSIRRKHISSKLGEDSYIVHAGGNKDSFVLSADALSDYHDVVRFLPRTVGNSHAARQIDEFN